MLMITISVVIKILHWFPNFNNSSIDGPEVGLPQLVHPFQPNDPNFTVWVTSVYIWKSDEGPIYIPDDCCRSVEQDLDIRITFSARCSDRFIIVLLLQNLGSEVGFKYVTLLLVASYKIMKNVFQLDTFKSKMHTSWSQRWKILAGIIFIKICSTRVSVREELRKFWIIDWNNTVIWFPQINPRL